MKKLVTRSATTLLALVMLFSCFPVLANASGYWSREEPYYVYYSNGSKLRNTWKKIDGYYRYFNGNGYMICWPSWINNSYVDINDCGCCKSGWIKVNGSFHYISNYTDSIGWRFLDGYYRYFDNNGVMITGWRQLDGYQRYFNEWGCMMTGWQTINGISYYFNEWGCLLQQENPKITSAVNWAINIANNNTHGYSQSNRWGPNYDCSSFVISAFKQAGAPTGGASYTGDMVSGFTNAGWKNVTSSVNLSNGSGLQKGDVVWKSGHTELYIGNNQLVGAHSNYDGRSGDSSGREISVDGYTNKGWTKVLRYVG